MSFLSMIKSFFGFSSNGHKSGPGDRKLTCEDCRKIFIFDEGEQRFFKTKGFTDPKRCPECRKKVRSHIRKKFRRGNRPKKFSERKHSLIDGRSPYADVRD